MKKDMIENPTTLLVGGARNAHGTRISKRIKCTKCGELDYVSSRPQKGKAMLCRSCAQTAIGAFEVGVKVPVPTATKVCHVCGCEFEVPVKVRLKGKPTCRDCQKGFDVWRGSLEMSPQNREEMMVESRASGILLRKRVAKP